MRKILALIAGLAASLAALLGFTAAPAAAVPQELAYYGPASVNVGYTADVGGYGFGNNNPATITTLTPAVCSVQPKSTPGAVWVKALASGDCVLRFQVAGGVAPRSGTYFDPINTTRTIVVRSASGLLW